MNAALTFSTFKHIRDTLPALHQIDPDRLTRHKARKEKDGPLYSPAIWAKGAKRGASGIEQLTGVVLDYDGDGADLDATLQRLAGIECVYHTTHSHNPARPKFRVVLPLAEPSTPDTWALVHHAAAELAGRAGLDPTCAEPSRAYYAPSCPPEFADAARAGHQAGRRLTVAELLDLSAKHHPPVEPPRSYGGGRPGDDYNARTTWGEVLTPHGFRLAFERNGTGYWQKPGGTGREHHATSNHGGTDCLYVFTPLTPLPNGQGLTKFAAFAYLNHGGDFAAAAKDLAQKGYGEPSPGKEKATTAKPERDEHHADAPLLFDDTETPEIPAALLPGWLGEFADALARSTQTPPALPVMLALVAVATCTARRFEVSPYGAGYTEPLNLWAPVVLPPAGNKTAVFNAITAPLIEYEQAEAERLAPIIKAAAIERRLIEKRIDKLERDAGNAETAADREALQREIAKLHDEMPPEVLAPRLFTSDCTPERLQGMLADHGGRMAVLSDEGGIFENMAGLYTGGQANIDVFLKGHAGSALRVDRQNRTAHIDAPALSFGLAIQPAVLADMATGGKRRFRGNGTLARNLYAVPKSNVGTRDVRAVYQIPPTVAARYRAGLFDLLALPPQLIDGREVPRRLTLTTDALECWLAFREMVERRQGPDGDLESISDWSGKLHGAALRIAGNLHLAQFGARPPAQIEAATIERALDLCALLIDHAKAAFALMDADPVTADAKALLRWITAGHLARFKRGEAYRHFKGRFTGRPERLDKALKELEARAIVTAATEPTPGRAATVYTVNGALW